MKPDRTSRAALKVGVYVFLSYVFTLVFGTAFGLLDSVLVALTLTMLAASLFANAFALRIFEGGHLADIGMYWNAASVRNLALGLAGGAGAALAVLALPVLAGLAYFRPESGGQAGAGPALFAVILLFAGAAGEEILFRGYAFQVLLRNAGAWATIIPVGVLFAFMHASNPNAWNYKLGLVNTAAFAILFGYGFLRSRDLWLPIGLHYGWNLSLLAFGVNISGITMGVTGYVLEWKTGPLWSGGEYGPEASVLTSAMFVLLGYYLWKAPIQRQPNPLLDASPEGSHA